MLIAGMLGAVFGFIGGLAFDKLATHTYLRSERFIIVLAPLMGAFGVGLGACITEAARDYLGRGAPETSTAAAKNVTDLVGYVLGATIGAGLMAALFEFFVILLALISDAGFLVALFVGILTSGLVAIPSMVLGSFLGFVLGGLGLLADQRTGARFLLGIAGSSFAAVMGALPVMLLLVYFNV